MKIEWSKRVSGIQEPDPAFRVLSLQPSHFTS